MRAWIGLLLIAPVVLTGCVASDDDGSTEQGTFVSAMENLDVAASRAQAWSSTARLAGTMGVEPSEEAIAEIDQDDPDDLLGPIATRVDPERPDGKAQAWWYLFTDATNETWRVAVSANGTVLAEGLADPSLTGTQISGWQVDSHEAVSIAKANNRTWDKVQDPWGTFAYLFETNQTTDPLWLLGIEQGGADLGWVVVNATTGRYLGDASGAQLGPFNASVDLGPAAEKGSFEDRVTAATPTNEHTFEIQTEGHPMLQVVAEHDVPQAPVNLTVVAPDGEVVYTKTFGGSGSGMIFMGTEQATVGTWTVTVELEDGAAQQYWVGWCATGLDTRPKPDEGRPDPCGDPGPGPAGDR